MNQSTHSLIINLVFFLGALLFWNYLCKHYILDSFRQKIFNLRAELFDIAASPEYSINFESEVYQLLRNIFNGTIRFGQNLRFTTYLTFEFLNKRIFPDRDVYRETNQRLQDLKLNITDELTQQKVLDLEKRYTEKVTTYLLLSSFTTMVVMGFIFISYLIKGIFKRTISPRKALKETENRLHKRIPNIEKQAELLSA